MPQIIVRAYTPDGIAGAVTLAERAVPTEQHNDHYVEQLIERVEWALIDAERLESQLDRSQACRPPRAKTQRTSDSGALRRRTANQRRRRTRLPAAEEGSR